MKERRNGSNGVSTLQIALSTGLISTFAILIVIAAPANSEKAMPQDRYGFQPEEGGDSITATATPTPSPCGTAGPGDAGGWQTGAPGPAIGELVSMDGYVFYCSNPVPAPVPGVTILINNVPDGTTDSSGHYSLVRKDGCSYCRVRPSQADRTPGSPGISTVDVVAVQQHFLVIGPPLSGCRLTAGDVNGDASINTIDVVAIQRFFLGFSTGIANVGKYQFNPQSRCFGHATNQNFDTLIFGDVAAPFIY